MTNGLTLHVGVLDELSTYRCCEHCLGECSDDHADPCAACLRARVERLQARIAEKRPMATGGWVPSGDGFPTGP